MAYVQIEQKAAAVHERSDPISDSLLKSFDQFIFSQRAVTALFFLLALAEVFLMFFFFTFLIQSALFAFSIAALLMTIFAYMMIKQYLEAQKPEKIAALVDAFLAECRGSCQKDSLDEHIAIATVCCKTSDLLRGREYHYFKPIPGFSFLSPHLEKLSCYLYWEDLHGLRELLLKTSLEEHLCLVRSEPISLSVHAALANAYVMLSQLYLDPRQVEGCDSDQWIPAGKTSEEMQKRFREAAEKAIQEFKILKEFAPNDPWVHTQLAYSYRDLKMPLEEMEAYETIVKLRPNDYDSLFKLGVLYFREGENALGLKTYEELKKAHFKKAEMLMNYYGVSKS